MAQELIQIGKKRTTVKRTTDTRKINLKEPRWREKEKKGVCVGVQGNLLWSARFLPLTCSAKKQKAIINGHEQKNAFH